MSKDENVNALIADLADELCEVKVMHHPFKRALCWIVVALAYVVVFAAFAGVRSDVAVSLSNPVFLYEVITVGAIFVSGAFATAWLCVPDMRGQKWLIAVPLTLFASFLLWASLRVILQQPPLPHMHVHSCVIDAALIGLVPAAAIVFMTNCGSTTRPMLSALMGMLSVGALGYVVLRFTCMSDALGHVGMFHFTPFVVAGGILGLLLSRFYRW